MNELDLDRITEIEAVSFKSPWSKVMLAAAMNFSGSLNFVLEENSVLSAYIFSRKTGSELHIINMAVAPSFRRQGLGVRLLSFLLQKARDRDATWAHLEVRKDNLGAIRLYKKEGFVIIETIPRYYEDGSDAYRMTMDINEYPDKSTHRME